MNLILFIMIDSLSTAILIVYFLGAVQQTRIISRSLYNLELNKTCFLIMVTNSFLGHRRVEGLRKLALYIIMLAIVILVYLRTMTGYVSLSLVTPLILTKLRIA